jgi:hypothetical protein
MISTTPAIDTSKAAGDYMQLIGKEGSFAIGVVFGCLVTFGANWLISLEHRKRLKIDFEREKELNGQLKLKDDRITELHKELERILLPKREK